MLPALSPRPLRSRHEFPHPPGRQKRFQAKSAVQKKALNAPEIKKTVLVIEDQRGFREIFTDILNHGGYEVAQAADGEEGWEMVKSLKPDLVLLDLMLPKIHGFEVLKKIRSEAETQGIPVMIISILDEPANRSKGLELGADDYLVKSHLSLQQILERISALLTP